jgi:hypothetical protein
MKISIGLGSGNGMAFPSVIGSVPRVGVACD